jgi:hypothetical protein
MLLYYLNGNGPITVAVTGLHLAMLIDNFDQIFSRFDIHVL